MGSHCWRTIQSAWVLCTRGQRTRAVIWRCAQIGIGQCGYAFMKGIVDIVVVIKTFHQIKEMNKNVPQKWETSQTSRNTWKNDRCAKLVSRVNMRRWHKTHTGDDTFIVTINNQKRLKEELWTILEYSVHCLNGIHITNSIDNHFSTFGFVINSSVFGDFT